MLNFKNKLAKRILAFVLSGTMVLSGMTTSSMTVFAADSSDKASYYEETDNTIDEAEEAEVVEGAETLKVDGEETEDPNPETQNPETPEPSQDPTPNPDPNPEPASTEVVKPSEPASAEVTKPSEPASTEENPSTEDESTEPTSDAPGGNKDEELVAMEANQTYTLDVSALAIEDGVALSSDKVFKLLAGNDTTIAADAATTRFIRLNAATGQLADENLQNKIVMGGDADIEAPAIKFQTPASADVVVFWVSKAPENYMEILDADGETVAQTTPSAIEKGIYISTMTLEDAGTYYLGGDNSVYKVVVTTPAAEKKHLTTLVSGNTTTWDFTTTTNFPKMEGSRTAIEGAAEEYYGLYIDANKNNISDSSSGKWYKDTERIQINTNAIVYIPLEGRSKVTVAATNDQLKYTMDGKASTGETDTFTCVGENGYAVMKVTAGKYLKSITVEKIKTAAVSGKVTGISSDECEITFTEKTANSAKSVITVPVEKVGSEYTYSADLYVGCTYTVSLSDKTVKITSGDEVTVAEADTTKTLNVETETMSTIEVSGDIVLPADAADTKDFEGLKITFKSANHTAEAEITDDSYTVTLESDSEYTITAEAAKINDYVCAPAKLTAGTADMTEQTITFTPQTTSKVTVNVTSFDEKFNISTSEITFTNKADDYTYTFTGVENIKLRNGTYAVSMDVEYPYALGTSNHKFADLTVSGASTYAINLVERMEWDFTGADPMLKSQTIQNQADEKSYHGLKIDSSGNKTVQLKDGSTYTTYGKFDVQANQVQVNTTTEVKIPVSGKGTVTITTSEANDTNHYTMDGKFATGDPQTWNYDNPESGYMTLQVTKTKVSGGQTATGSIYLKNIKVVRTDAGTTKPPATEESSSAEQSSEEQSREEQSREEQSSAEQSSEEQSSDVGSLEYATGSGKIDVWDFGAKAETDTAHYTNNITFDVLKATNEIVEGVFKGNPVPLGDVTIYTSNSCRLYSADAELSGGNNATAGYAKQVYDDGYTSAGGWYAGGNGGSGRRYLTISNVKAGDKIVAYMNLTNGGPTQFYFEGQGTASAQKDAVDISGTGVNKKYEFIAKYDGTYKIWEKGDGKPMYHRIMRVPPVNVSGTIDLGPLESLEGVTLKFVNETTNGETVATLDGTRFTVKLVAGYTYNAVLSGATGYGPTNESKKVTLLDTDGLNGKSGVKIVIEEKQLYTYSGTIKGFAQDYSKKSNLQVVMKTAEDVPNDDVKLTITELDSENPKFTATLEPDIEYTITLEGVNDYQVKGEATVNKNQAYTADIEVELKPTYEAKGNFVDLDGNAVTGVTALTFKNVDDNYEYTATIAADGKSYTASLRDGAYSAEATIEKYQTGTHVVVDGKSVTKDILFVSTVTEGELTRKADLYVGYSDKDDANYETVDKAVKAAKRMNPSSEAERITIHIAPGVYREQIIVDVPYISFVNDTPDKEVRLTWYQGIGYQYYSCASGYYNAQDAHDQYQKGTPQNWGATVQLKAAGFLAENITFEHSLNRYITEEEIADGVEPTAGGGKPVRNYNLDVKSKDATERGAAFYFASDNADNAEFYRCKFLSSQDTLGTCKGNQSAYFKECFMEGNTDFICGDGNVIFDSCVLSLYGYSDKDQSGYITAAQDDAEYGYLFRNCTVKRNPDKDMKVNPTHLGRPWRQDAKVTFVNTKLESANLITAEGWTEMSGATPGKANFAEYNTTSLDGKPVDTSKRVAGTVKTENPAPNVSVYFGGWKPKYYVEEADGEVAISGNVTITDNADINAPKAGNTLTVHYSLGDHDANDASLIKWYTVEKDENGNEKAGTEKLVKASTASAGKTYKIEVADNAVGKYIKVTVTPQTISGKIGEAKSCTLENPVREGYEDPSSGGDITLGDGINIFLAGDSTVKDYSANGMNNSGKALYEGSWGEFLQSFFNESQVKVQNYAQGGRSTRTFINDGRLKSIAENMSEGDYLFIQFGHNDCADGADYVDRYVPVGTPDANKQYPYTEGTPDKDGIYQNDCGGTYKWFLKLYIDTAREKGGIPVLVTPVARMYYDKDGKIYEHHNTSKSEKNAYVIAMKQVAQDENVLLIDGYQLTKELFDAAWKADGNNNDTYGKQIMHSGDKTHNNKLGGMIEAAVLAKAIQNMDLTISGAVKAPKQVLGATPDGKTVFTVNGSGKLTAYDILTDYTAKAAYWEKIGQAMFDEIGGNAEELNRRVGEITANPVPGPVEKNTTVKLTCATDGATIHYTTDGKIPTEQSASYTGPISLGATEGIVTIKAIGVKEGYKNSIVYTFDYTVSGDTQNPGGEVGDTEETKIIVDAGDKDGRISVKSDAIKIEAANLAETGKVQYAVTVNYNQNGKMQQLTEGVHYTVEFITDGKSPIEQKINIEGTGVKTDLGTFVDKKKVTYTIKAKAEAKQDKAHDISKKKFTLDSDQAKNAVYTGTYITPSVQDNDSVGEANYSVVYKNNVNVGKASVTIIGKNEYYGTKTLTFSIKKADLSKQTVGITANNATFGDPTVGKTRAATEKTSGDFNYKGKAVTFDNLIVKLGNVALSPRSDYTITYKKNTQVGTAIATIKGANNLSGAITITYDIGLVDVMTELAKCNTDETALEAEYSSKGARLTSITLSGVTLKEGTDYKVDYKNCTKADSITIGTTIDTVTVTGVGSYKNKLSGEVKIKVGKGSFHVKDGAVVDKSKFAKVEGDESKFNKAFIGAAKITDAAGVTIKPEAVSGKIAYTNTTVTVTPADTEKYAPTTLGCHVATKLSSVKPTDKTAKIEDKKFDGVNAVTLTETEIVKSKLLDGVNATDICIVSYKNNNKAGSATVIIEGRPQSAFYGTKSLKFKIVTDKKPAYKDGGKEESDTGESASVDPSTGGEPNSEPSTGDEPNSEPSTGNEPNSEPSTGDEPNSEPGTEPGTEPENPTDQKHTVWVVGDSTVSPFNDAYYYPRYGYGTQLQNYLDENYTVNNLALSGRSSLSFLSESNYTTLKNGMKAGDILIIGFGHNDEKQGEDDRFTDPTGDWQTEGSFANTLYDKYVKVAESKGATAIICTPIVRRTTGEYKGSVLHITSDKEVNGELYKGGSYPDAIKKLGEDKGVKVVDLTTLTKEAWEPLGNDGTLKLHAWTSNKEASVDNTHLNIYGAKKVAYILATELAKFSDLDIASHVQTEGKEPTEADLVPNPNYVIPDVSGYQPPTGKSQYWDNYGIFKGTVFGTVNKTISDKQYHKLEKDANGNMRIAVLQNSTKISSTEDGRAMYYYQIPATSTFEFSAKAKINAIDANGQVAFGLMARDDMFIDKQGEGILSDYVAAGTFGQNSTNSFRRKDGELKKGPALGTDVKAGETYSMSIVKNTDGFACTFGDNEAQSGGYDFQLTQVDAEYQYIGMFVSRNADITFSDIKLTVDGQAVDLQLPQ